MQVSKTSLDLVKSVAKNNSRLINLPLKDSSTAKILCKDNEMDCLIMKNGKTVGGCGAKGNSEFVQKELKNLFGKLQNLVDEGFDLNKNFSEIFRKVK